MVFDHLSAVNAGSPSSLVPPDGRGRALLSDNAFKRRDTYSTMDGHVAIKGLTLGGVITQVLRPGGAWPCMRGRPCRRARLFQSRSHVVLDVHALLRMQDVLLQTMMQPGCRDQALTDVLSFWRPRMANARCGGADVTRGFLSGSVGPSSLSACGCLR